MDQGADEQAVLDLDQGKSAAEGALNYVRKPEPLPGFGESLPAFNFSV